ncbi:MAG: cobalamin biosynthesis protein P47K, partial [Planctomycetota bacterium]
VDEVIGFIESPMEAGRRLLEIDYDTYADGEAELGWVNLSAIVEADVAVDGDELARELVTRIGQGIIEAKDAAIAHVKVSVSGNGFHSVANLVDNFNTVEMGLASHQRLTGRLELVINARVAIDPSCLLDHCEKALEAVAAAHALAVESSNARSLRPGRPVPTHRVTAN